MLLDVPTMAAAYDLLRTTLPFRRWKLPHSSDVTFKIIKNPAHMGLFSLKNGRPLIEINGVKHNTLPLLIETMAHEMIHLHERTYHGARTDVEHSWLFKRYARQVCRHHGFNKENF